MPFIFFRFNNTRDVPFRPIKSMCTPRPSPESSADAPSAPFSPLLYNGVSDLSVFELPHILAGPSMDVCCSCTYYIGVCICVRARGNKSAFVLRTRADVLLTGKYL